MPEIVEIRDIQCFAQRTHGFNPTAEYENLVGNVLEKVNLYFNVYVSVVAFTESPLVPEYNSAGEATGKTPAVKDWYVSRIGGEAGTLLLTRSSGSFLDDGFSAGDRYYSCNDWNNRYSLDSWEKLDDNETLEYFSILEISQDGKTLHAYPQGTQGTYEGGLGNVGIVKLPIESANQPAKEYAYGLTPKGANPSYSSAVTGERQQFFLREGLKPSTFMKVKGDSSAWKSGRVTVEKATEKISEGLEDLLIFPAKYVVNHVFYVTPFFNEEIRLLLNAWKKNEPIETPAELLGAATLDYSFELTIRDKLTSKDGEVVVRETIPGNVGWFNENYNNFGNPFAICELKDAEGIYVQKTPFIVRAQFKDDYGDIPGDKNHNLYDAWATLFRIPSDESEYVNTRTALEENFIIKRIKDVRPDDELTEDWAFAGFDFTPEEKSRIKRGDRYLLAFSMAKKKDGDVADTGKRAQVIADIGYFVFDPPLEGYVETALQIVDGYASNYQCSSPGLPYTDDYLDVFDEDIVNVWAQINFKRFVNRVSGNGKTEMVVDQTAFGLVAENSVTGERFEIDRFEMPLPGDSGGTNHDYHIEGKRVYTTEVDQSSDALFTCEGDEKNYERTNYWRITYNECPIFPEQSDKCQYKDNGDVIREYHLNCSQAVRWQEWWRNGKVPETFFDPSKPADGLNRKSSRFSNKQNFDVFLGVFFRIRGETKEGEEVSGEEFEKIRRLKVWGYGEEPPGTPTNFEGKLEIFIVRKDSNDNEVLIESAAVVVGEQMLTRSTYKYFEDNNYVIHRIEESKNATDIIWESGTGYFNKAYDNPLYTKQDDIPSDKRWAKNTARLEDGGNTLISECYLDGTMLKKGRKYKISSRLGYSPNVSLPVEVQWGFTSDDGALLTGDDGAVLQQDH